MTDYEKALEEFKARGGTVTVCDPMPAMGDMKVPKRDGSDGKEAFKNSMRSMFMHARPKNGVFVPPPATDEGREEVRQILKAKKARVRAKKAKDPLGMTAPKSDCAERDRKIVSMLCTKKHTARQVAEKLGLALSVVEGVWKRKRPRDVRLNNRIYRQMIRRVVALVYSSDDALTIRQVANWFGLTRDQVERDLYKSGIRTHAPYCKTERNADVFIKIHEERRSFASVAREMDVSPKRVRVIYTRECKRREVTPL